MKACLILLLVIVSTSAVAQKEIPVEDAANHVGDSVKICSKVFGGRYFENPKGDITLLNLGDAYPNSPLTVVIKGNLRKEFREAPETHLPGKQVCVTGKIELYNGRPEIVLFRADQLKEMIIDKMPNTSPK